MHGREDGKDGDNVIDDDRDLPETLADLIAEIEEYLHQIGEELPANELP